MTSMAEKPPRGTEPANLAISGRCILQPEIVAIPADQERGAGGAFPLVVALVLKRQDFGPAARQAVMELLTGSHG